MRRGPLAAAASGVGLLGVLITHHGGPAVIATRPHGSGTTMPPAIQPTPTTKPTGTTTPPPPGATRSAVGAAEQYGYGVLSVKVTVRGTRIVDVSIANLQTLESYSQSIADQVIPTLRNEVLSGQTAQVNGISGATYTSEAYAYSVQSALDQLHI